MARDQMLSEAAGKRHQMIGRDRSGDRYAHRFHLLADPGLAAPIARCVPAGCFADFELKDDVPKKFRAAAGGGRVLFADASGRGITIPLSFNGFTQALDALAKE